MKHTLLIFTSLYSFILSGQDLKWNNTIDGDFVIDSVTLGEDSNIINVSGKAGDYVVYMTYNFTNIHSTSNQGEYTALAWAQDGDQFLETTVRGLWKKNEQVFEIKHFENATDGSQLLTTGTMDFQAKTYKCKVRFLE
tara:strand:- start:187 stop:600 length:414 start_codon:yes stop_codon:yes gene_type:complete